MLTENTRIIARGVSGPGKNGPVHLARLPAAQQQDLVGVAQLLLLELDVLVDLLVDAEAVRPPRHALPVRHLRVPGLEAGDGALADGAHHHLHLLASHAQARGRASWLTTSLVNILQSTPNQIILRPFEEKIYLETIVRKCCKLLTPVCDCLDTYFTELQ